MDDFKMSIGEEGRENPLVTPTGSPSAKSDVLALPTDKRTAEVKDMHALPLTHINRIIWAYPVVQNFL